MGCGAEQGGSIWGAKLELKCGGTEAGEAGREAGAGGGIFTQRKSSQGEPAGGRGSGPRAAPHLPPARPGRPARGQLQPTPQVGGRPGSALVASGRCGCGAASLRGTRLGAAGGTRLKVAPVCFLGFQTRRGN